MSFTKRVAVIVSLFIAAPGIARADLFTDWNAVAYDLMRMANVDGARRSCTCHHARLPSRRGEHNTEPSH